MKRISLLAVFLLTSLGGVSHAQEWSVVVGASQTEVMEPDHLCFSTGGDNISCSQRGLGVNAAGDVSVSGVITLPITSGATGVSQSVPGDNMGSHSASQNLDMNGYSIINVDKSTFEVTTGAAGVSQSVPGDNLGTHTATQDLDMNDNAISGVTNVHMADTVAPDCSTNDDAGKMFYDATLKRFRICR